MSGHLPIVHHLAAIKGLVRERIFRAELFFYLCK